jgi:hypothetical protein
MVPPHIAKRYGYGDDPKASKEAWTTICDGDEGR